MDPGLEDFLERIEEVTQEVKGILSGDIDVTKSVQKEEMKKRREEEKKQAEENKKRMGNEGKGIHFDKYQRYCEKCCVEFQIDIEKCSRCGNDTITSEQRREYLTQKVEKLKKERIQKQMRKVRWENWKKTQAMLYRKTATNYKKWDYFEDDEEEEEKEDFVPPADDPNFRALEQDIKERADRRKRDKIIAEELKTKGNQFFQAGKFRNALLKYEEALQHKKDYLVLYTNCAIARIKIEDYENAIKDCDRVLEYCEVFEDGYQKSKDVCFKALTRRAMANRALGNFSQACIDLEQALDLKEDNQAKALLKRCQQDFQVSGSNTVVELIENAEEVIEMLQSEEQVQEFIQNNGYTRIVQQIYEGRDQEAVKILRFLCNKYELYNYLAPLAKPVYDRRRIGAVVLLLTIQENLDNLEFCKDLVQILSYIVENTEIREEIVTHSGTTKGVRFCKLVMKLFIQLGQRDFEPIVVSILEYLIPLMSNLCLSNYKSAVRQDPNPGNFKDITRYNWQTISSILTKCLQQEQLQNEVIGYFCNITTSESCKLKLIQDQDMIGVASSIIQGSTNSLVIEKGLGFYVNLLTSPPEPTPQVLNISFEFLCRTYRFTKSTDLIVIRSFILLTRLSLKSAEHHNQIAQDTYISQAILQALDKPEIIHNSIKIMAAIVPQSQQFADRIPVDTILKIAQNWFEDYIENNNGHDRCSNLALLIGKLGESLPEKQGLFRPIISQLLQIVKDKHGQARKNGAVCLAKLAKNPDNIEELRNLHGIEVLQSIAKYVV